MHSNVRHEMVALLPRLRRFACGLTGSIDDADEVVQAACERALTRLDQFTPGTRLDSWMFQIIRSIWFNKIRDRKRNNYVDDPGRAESVEFDARIHEQASARMDLAIIRVAIGKLPVEQREVLFLVTLDGMSYQEAADTLEIPIGTVMSRLARARRKLADAVNAGAPDLETEHKKARPTS